MGYRTDFYTSKLDCRFLFYRSHGAWPKPVWGVVEAIPYEKQRLVDLLDNLKTVLTELDFSFF